MKTMNNRKNTGDLKLKINLIREKSKNEEWEEINSSTSFSTSSRTSEEFSVVNNDIRRRRSATHSSGEGTYNFTPRKVSNTEGDIDTCITDILKHSSGHGENLRHDIKEISENIELFEENEEHLVTLSESKAPTKDVDAHRNDTEVAKLTTKCKTCKLVFLKYVLPFIVVLGILIGGFFVYDIYRGQVCCFVLL